MIRVAKLEPRYFRWLFLDKFPSEFDDGGTFGDWLVEQEWVHDTDSGGNRTSYWVEIEGLSEPEFWRCDHDYGWEGYGTDDASIYNDFTIEKCLKENLSVTAKEALKYVV